MVPITPENILAHEWIGLHVIAKTGQKTVTGKITDETKQTFIMEDQNKVEKKIVKKDAIFEVTLGNKKVRVQGNALVFRSEDRIKMAKRGK